MRVVIFTKDNSNRMGALTAEAFLQSSHEVVAVISNAAHLNKMPEVPVLEFEDHNAPKVQEALKKLQPDILVIADDIILKPEIYTKAAYAINWHPGILPLYRGSNTNVHAVLNNDIANIGFTIHCVEEKLDTGDILYKEKVKADSITALQEACETHGAEKLVFITTLLEQGKITPVPQDVSKGKTYAGPLTQEQVDLANRIISSSLPQDSQ